ncbi:uncharacterized protein AMSG_04618 [Thecamonas trahens ATCC 50062]|uniref:Uncharacterized protein n=1 Tax=Thecamonas trahens ATCC 50062 TaxID=461836 RepID=A0A0L0DC41_THETB|nr:hypothetical protein AMSG_04618 [Thecamonas trahens ATCC 50062]KNC48873.1 hypothetical protein AMSG_04618 [Thecamonas trahens ATCC 50062]|eukprot:XP_013758293.1 hypothetical protein AMSG_04618 [Thecamonas trahens ATCC 50062]
MASRTASASDSGSQSGDGGSWSASGSYTVSLPASPTRSLLPTMESAVLRPEGRHGLEQPASPPSPRITVAPASLTGRRRGKAAASVEDCDETQPGTPQKHSSPAEQLRAAGDERFEATNSVVASMDALVAAQHQALVMGNFREVAKARKAIVQARAALPRTIAADLGVARRRDAEALAQMKHDVLEEFESETAALEARLRAQAAARREALEAKHAREEEELWAKVEAVPVAFHWSSSLLNAAARIEALMAADEWDAVERAMPQFERSKEDELARCTGVAHAKAMRQVESLRKRQARQLDRVDDRNRERRRHALAKRRAHRERIHKAFRNMAADLQEHYAVLGRRANKFGHAFGLASAAGSGPAAAASAAARAEYDPQLSPLSPIKRRQLESASGVVCDSPSRPLTPLRGAARSPSRGGRSSPSPGGAVSQRAGLRTRHKPNLLAARL